MYVVVEERTREIGVKLAVGAKPRFIQTQFLLETLTLTAIGGLLGFLVTLGILFVFPFLKLDEYVGTPQASPLVVVVTAALLGLIGLVAGYFPARRASLLDPVVALKTRHELRGRRARPRLAPVPRRPRAPDQAHRAHGSRDRLGHALDRAAALLRRGPEALAAEGHARDGRGHRGRLAGRDDAGVDGPALRTADPDQGRGPRAAARADPGDRAALGRVREVRAAHRGHRRASTRACAVSTPSTARCATSTRSPAAAS